MIFFGLLVHQTIEEIHRIALDGKLNTLDESRIRALFDRCFQFLCLSDVRPIGDTAREVAFQQVMNYYSQNQDEMRRIIQTGVDVSLEKDGYILRGKVDLLRGCFMSTQVMVTSPDDLYRRGERLAQLTSCDVSDVLVDTIALSLTSLSSQPASVTPVTELTDEEVLSQAESQMAPGQDRRLSTLLHRQQAGSFLTWNVRKC